MIKNFKSIFNSLSYTFSSNIVNLLTSFFMIFFVPKFIGVESYAYWQLYIFYTTYLQYLTFGIPEGIYLEFGGYELNDLPEKNLRNQFGNLLGISVVLVVFFNIIILFFSNYNPTKIIVLILSSIAMILIVPRSVLTYELQATNEIKSFSLSMIMEKFFLFVGLISLVVFKQNEYWKFIIVDIISKLITNLYLLKICKKFVFGKYLKFLDGVRESAQFVKSGLNITLSNISSILVNGIIRLIIEINWSIEIFGKVSLIMSMNNMVMVFINSISIVLFPILRRTNLSKLKKNFFRLDYYGSYGALNILFLYYPIYLFLYYFLPDYRDSLSYMTLIFPMTIFESQIGVLYNTYLKTFRKEKIIFRINILMVVFSLAAAIPIGLIFNSLIGSISLVLVISIIKYLSLKHYLYKFCLDKKARNYLVPLIFTILFLIFTSYFSVINSFVIISIGLMITNMSVYLKWKFFGGIKC